MFGLKTYKLVCHGCGKFHTKESAFLSLPTSIGFKLSDGGELCVPACSCGECPREAIMRAFDSGMSHVSRARANGEVAAFFPEHEFAST